LEKTSPEILPNIKSQIVPIKSRVLQILKFEILEKTVAFGPHY
jgi:hypothetical protein